MENAKMIEPLRKELSYDDKVIRKIAGIATDSVQGILAVSGGLVGGLADNLRAGDKTKGIDAEVGKKQTALDVTVVCEYGRNIPQLLDAVTEKVRQAILTMTGLELVELNMHVSDVVSREDFAEMRQKQLGGDASGDDTQLYVSPGSRQVQGARVQ